MKWDERIGRRVKLHDLHVFITVAELGSMRKAAERLAVSQPSVSKAIADIEHILRVRLLERNAHGVVATPYGRALLRRAMAAFDELRQGVKDIEALADPTLGEVRIGCPEAIAAGLLPAVVDRFSRRYPRVLVSVKAADDLAPEFGPLRERVVDLMIGRVGEQHRDDDLNIEVLYWDRIFVATGRKAPWARRRTVTLAGLMEHPWLLFPENSWIDARVTEAFGRCGIAPPRSIVRAYSVHFCINMLATNRFVASLAGSVLRFNAPQFGLKILPVSLPAQPWPVAMVSLKNRTVSPVVQEFMKDVCTVATTVALAKSLSRSRPGQSEWHHLNP
jgi:DNA-binding transcriptional LysR family regulator